MPLRGSVGKHTRSGGLVDVQCWSDDQKTVIDLLNRIPDTDGGAGGTLSSEHVRSGICSDALYHAIQKFEDKHFHNQHSGFVDPVRTQGKQLFDRMEELAKRPAPKPAPESPLDILRRNVQNVDIVRVLWTAGDRVRLDELACDG